LYGRGGLSDLLRFDQPAVLILDGGGKGREYEVVLSALDDKMATFLIAGTRRQVPPSELGPLWSGNYILLWRPAPGLPTMLAEGSRGPAVSWLRQELERVTGASANGPALFDKDLTRRLKAFQLAEGIVPDGVAGPLTLVRLGLRIDDNLPRLKARGGGN
jgi:general secretion pathway protein A